MANAYGETIGLSYAADMPAVVPARPSEARAGDSRAALYAAGARGIRCILVCLDRSSLSEESLPQAIAIARVFGSGLTLLYVQPPPDHPGTRITDPLDWEVSRREASAYLERLAEDGRRAFGLSIESRIEQGRPAERIASIAHEVRADLTVIASHGEGGDAPWRLGSTAQHILALVRSSVLVTRAATRAVPFEGPHRILVPLDGSTRTESVLPTAGRIAATHGAEVLLAHVVAEPHPTAMLHGEDLELARALSARIESRAQRYLEHLGARMPEGVRVRAIVTRHADERQSLLEITSRHDVDLLLLSAHGSACNPSRPFGSVTQHLLSQASVPLLVVQDVSEPELGVSGEDLSAPPPRSSYASGGEG